MTPLLWTSLAVDEAQWIELGGPDFNEQEPPCMHAFGVLPTGDVVLTMVIPYVANLEVRNMLCQRLEWDLDVTLEEQVTLAASPTPLR